MSLAEIRDAGGPGSGNYGHAGRPGEIGGSAPGAGTGPRSWGDLKFRFDWEGGTPRDTPPERTSSGDYVFYHGTSVTAEKTIQADGLKPDDINRVGIGTRPGAVSVFALMKGSVDPEQRAILRLVIDRNWIETHARLEREGNHDDLFLLSATPDVGKRSAPRDWGGIPRSALKSIRNVYTDFMEERTLGGPGSGNYGHAGRPGEVGGSAPSGTGALDNTTSRLAGMSQLERAINDLLPSRDPAALAPFDPVLVDRGELETRTGELVLEVLTEMKKQGYTMPYQVGVLISGIEPAGQTQFPDIWNKQPGLTIFLPNNLPGDANLDDAVMVAYGRDNEYTVRTMKDVIIHEMGHVQAGNRGQMPLGPMDAAVARTVSKYADMNTDEFLAETFTRLYRGEVLSDPVMALYKKLRGPEVYH